MTPALGPHIPPDGQGVSAPQGLSKFQDIEERVEHGFTVLSLAGRPPGRRILYINGYGGRSTWRQIQQREVPSHHLWGCVELVRMGYEIALADPISYFNYRRPIPHDSKFLRMITSWLGARGIVYCAQNSLFWIPLLKTFRMFRAPVVSMLYAREPLDFPQGHAGVLALTPPAAKQAKQLAPRAKIAHVGWGVDLGFLTPLRYQPTWLLSCGITQRDFDVLRQACALFAHPVHLIVPGLAPGSKWPRNVTTIDGGPGWNCASTKKLTLGDIITHHYTGSAATLVILKKDPHQKTACGFTNVLESMALSLPVVATRTGALTDEIDLEHSGCGLLVEPDSPVAIAHAVERIVADADRAALMGKAGRRLCEAHYNINRYATDLHRFFETL